MQNKQVSKIAHDILGSEQRVVFMLHGWGQNRESLRPLANLLAKSFTIYLIDLPGFGDSEQPPYAWDTLDYAEAIESFADSKGIDKLMLVGHSFGGRVSIRFASRYPERVEKLALIASHGLKTPRNFRSAARITLIRTLRNIVKLSDKLSLTDEMFKRWFVPRFASSDYKAAGEMKNILVKAVNEDLSEEARRILAPTLILNGTEDSSTPPQIAVNLAELIPKSELLLLEGHDHFPFSDVGSHLVAFYLGRFFETQGARDGY